MLTFALIQIRKLQVWTYRTLNWRLTCWALPKIIKVSKISYTVYPYYVNDTCVCTPPSQIKAKEIHQGERTEQKFTLKSRQGLTFDKNLWCFSSLACCTPVSCTSPTVFPYLSDILIWPRCTFFVEWWHTNKLDWSWIDKRTKVKPKTQILKTTCHATCESYFQSQKSTSKIFPAGE